MGSQGGLKTIAGSFFQEKVYTKEWETFYVRCCSSLEEPIASLSYKRMIALMYEITCRSDKSTGEVI